MSKQLHYTKASVTKIDKENGTFEVIASTSDVDRDREVIDSKGWELGNFLKNPIILWAHSHNELPIGVAEKVERTDNELKIKGRFASAEANPKAQQVRRLIEEGVQTAVSVGFIPLERDEKDSSIITKAELLELSFVPVPSNPHALALAAEKGFDPEKNPELFEKKASHNDNPICDPNSDQYDPDKCAELQREAGETETPEKKDVAETVALAGVLDHLDFLIFAFGNNEVSENVLGMMREAQTLLLKALKAEATLGKKEFTKQGGDETTDIQTLILSKERFETLAEAKTWISDNGFRSDKVDETENSFRFRQIEPSKCQEDSFRTIEITNGVQAVICRPKKSLEVQHEEAPQNSKDNIRQLSESTGEQAGGTTPDRDGGSSKGDNAITELSTTTVRELRKNTLQTYHACEKILTITKRELDARKR